MVMGACQTKEVVCKVQGLGKRIFICFAVARQIPRRTPVPCVVEPFNLQQLYILRNTKEQLGHKKPQTEIEGFLENGKEEMSLV